MFLGRQDELKILRKYHRQKRAHFILIQGRRRIGKSTLVEKSAHEYKVPFYKLEGLPPREGQTNQDQIDHFVKELKHYFGEKAVNRVDTVNDWLTAFRLLYRCIKTKPCILFLDEISWTGAHDPEFAGHLKIIWDQELAKKPGLLFFVCGSVSTWIDKNIASNTGFVGRISLSLHLKELPLPNCFEFFKGSHFTSFEILKILCMVGGVPRYLEEFRSQDSLLSNVIRLFFQTSGLLNSEYQNLFSEIFGRRHKNYQKIIQALIDKKPFPSELARELDLDLNSDYSQALSDLELAGFIARDFNWNFNSDRMAKVSRLRISDNYSRFFLKYVLPRQERLKKSPLKLSDSLNFINWDSIMGLQFENLVMNNLEMIYESLEISRSDVINVGSYSQRPNLKQKGVQIDLLIQTKHNVLFFGELKCRSKIGVEVNNDV